MSSMQRTNAPVGSVLTPSLTLSPESSMSPSTAGWGDLASWDRMPVRMRFIGSGRSGRVVSRSKTAVRKGGSS